MKNSVSKLTFALSALAVAGFFAQPAFAADDATPPAQEEQKPKKKGDWKAKKEARDLKKYDANGNGVLDPDEQAARKADEEKMKAKKKKKAEAHEGEAE